MCEAQTCDASLQLAILGTLTKGWNIAACRIDPAWCSKTYHEYKLTVHVHLASNTTATNSTNGTHGVHAEQRTVFSSLDAMSSCDTIILVLLLQGYNLHDVHCACMLACVAAS